MRRRRFQFTDPVGEWNADNREYDKDELLEQIAAALSRMDDASPRDYDKFHTFFDSVTSKLKDIKRQVMSVGEVSRKQYETTQNIISGISKCLGDNNE